jgi:hypothetical protein
MILPQSKTERIQTKLQPGDIIHVGPAGSIAIFRNDTLMTFVDDPYITGYYLQIEASHGVGHEYAWWLARAIASVAGLFVVDSYTLSTQGYHTFPVTDIQPTQLGTYIPGA